MHAVQTKNALPGHVRPHGVFNTTTNRLTIAIQTVERAILRIALTVRHLFVWIRWPRLAGAGATICSLITLSSSTTSGHTSRILYGASHEPPQDLSPGKCKSIEPFEPTHHVLEVDRYLRTLLRVLSVRFEARNYCGRMSAVFFSIAHVLRRDSNHRLHIGMIAAVVINDASFLQNRADRLVRRNRHIPVAASSGGSMSKYVLVDPLDGIAYFARDLGRQNHQILHCDLDSSRLCRYRAAHHREHNNWENPPRAHGALPIYFKPAATCSACCSCP